jgi:DNA-binding transcriptional LysR family regulator
MEFKDLELLQALIQDPHLSRAAQRFHLSQSGLSKRLQNLEESLGMRLFDRKGPRGLAPTAAALEIAQLSERVLTAWKSGLQKAKYHLDEPLHFGMVGPQIFMREIILPWWNQVASSFPELSLEVHVSALSRVSFELVQAGMDVGILEHKEELEDFICKPIFTETWGIVSHPKAKFDLDSADSLNQLIWGTLSPQVNPVDEWLVRRQKMRPPFYRVYWNDLTALSKWVAATPQAATVLPEHACQSAIKQNTVRFTSLGKDSKRVLYLAYRQNHPHKKIIQNLLNRVATV